MAELDPPVDTPAAPGSTPPEPPPRPDPIPRTEPEPATTSPPPYSRAPFWIGLLLLLGFGAVAVGVVAALARPDVCDGTTFRSSRFGYCLVVPDGWTADGEGTLGQIPADRIQVPGGIATVYIQAVPIDEGQTLRDLADTIRSLNAKAGYQLDAISEPTVAGVPAMSWDLTTGVSGGVPMKMREIVFVDGANGWRVQVAETKPRFDDTAAIVDVMLGTWVFA
jgi:hypothetical protein